MNDSNNMQRNKLLIIIILCFIFNLSYLFCFSSNATNDEISCVKDENNFSYKIQQYTGFNFLINYLGEKTSEFYIKRKTHAKKTFIVLETYSGWDLLKKRLKGAKITAHDLSIKDIPISDFDFQTNGPICFKKTINKKTWFAEEVPFKSNIKIDLSLGSKLLLGTKLKKLTTESDNDSLEVELPVPPFGTTKVQIGNFDVMLLNCEEINITSNLKSVSNPDSAPIKVDFVGKVELENKELRVKGLKTSIEDIFTKDSELGRHFSKFIEDIINPIFSFKKLEKKGLKIDSVDMKCENNLLLLEIDGSFIPKD